VAAPSTLRLAEVLAAISLASDVGHDRPLETSLRNAVIAARLGEEPGLARDEPAVAHGVSLLRSMGCTGTALLFGGGDRAFVGLVQELAGGDSRALVRRMADHVSSSTPALEAARDERWFLIAPAPAGAERRRRVRAAARAATRCRSRCARRRPAPTARAGSAIFAMEHRLPRAISRVPRLWAVISRSPAISSSAMVRTIIQLREAQADALERAARRRGVSKAAIVREALDALLAREGPDAALDRALRAAGSGASGVNDLAERHDDHLAELSEA
jgi:hypothetical protein